MEFTTVGGAKVVITESGFLQANALKKSLLPALKNLKEFNTEKISDLKNQDISILLNPLVDICISDEVESRIFDCLNRGTYNGVRIDRALFDDPELGEIARKDYHEICVAAIKVNVLPFFAQTFSWLKIEKNLKSLLQKSK